MAFVKISWLIMSNSYNDVANLTSVINKTRNKPKVRLVPVLKTIFHQCVISYTHSQSNSDSSVLKQSHQS